MQEVLTKIQDLHSLLEMRIAAYENKYAELKSVIGDIDAKQRKLDATQNSLAASERRLKTYKDFEGAKDRARISNKKAIDMQLEVEKKAACLDGGIKDVAAKTAELEKLIAIYKRKDVNLEAAKKKLAADRRKMKNDILDELRGK